MTASPLNVHTAEVTTAAVEIKTLTIRGKQVTLAVFRQLREKELVLEDGTLAGVPWGHVNYHPDKCADWARHWHIIWQDGTELRRSAVTRKALWPRIFEPDSADCFLSACAVEESGGKLHYFGGNLDDVEKTFTPPDHPEFYIRGWIQRPVIAYQETSKRVEECRRIVKQKEELVEMNPANSRWAADLCRAQEKLAEADKDDQKAYIAMSAYYEKIGTADECFRRLVADAQAELARRTRHVELRDALADLPQLFIAV